MFLSAIDTYIVVTLIALIVVQYAIALFCLLKLAYLDISKRDYVLWNLLVLLVFFIGDAIFLIYYYKVGKNKKIPPYVPPVEDDSETDAETGDGDGQEKPIPQTDAQTEVAPNEPEPKEESDAQEKEPVETDETAADKAEEESKINQ